jgi:hypothetical protein
LIFRPLFFAPGGVLMRPDDGGIDDQMLWGQTVPHLSPGPFLCAPISKPPELTQARAGVSARLVS